MAKGKKFQPKPREGDQFLEEFAYEALRAYRGELDKDYAELIEAYDGYAAAIGVFGVGSVTVAVIDGEAVINPDPEKCPPLKARAATYPEVVSSLSRAEVTALDAFHRGDIAIQVDDSEELHRAYTFYARLSGNALASRELVGLASKFEKAMG